MNAPLQNGLQAAVARAHKKPKVFWAEKEQALVVAETDRLLLGADPAHTNLGPYIKIAQVALLPAERHRCVNSLLIKQVRKALLGMAQLQAPAPEPVVATPSATVYRLWREVSLDQFVDILDEYPDTRWRKANNGRVKVVTREFRNAEELAAYYVELGWVEEVTP